MLVARRLSRRTGDAVDKGCSVDKADPVDKPFSVDKPTFVSLSFCCGIRNVTAGAVLATQYFGPEVLFPAIIATPFQQVLAAAFGRIMERALARGEKSDA
jgi:predicted Na+-dependent transporter